MTKPNLFDALSQRYETETSAAPDGFDAPEMYDYVRFKAFVFLTVGPEVYRESDPLGQPPEGWPEFVLEKVRHACQQLLDWRGHTADHPLDGVGVGVFYALMSLFHFSCVEQQAFITEADPGYVYDRMEMRHIVTGEPLVLFNRVPLPGRDGRADVPCPYCGAELTTPLARQCLVCGTDWRDPADPRRLEPSRGA